MAHLDYIVKLEGGLGNQLFQYAHAVALQSLYGGRIVLDKHAFNKKQIRCCALENYELDDNTQCEMSLLQKVVSLYFILLGRIARRNNLITNQKQFESFVRKGLYYQYKTRCYDSLIKPKLPINYITGNWLSPLCFQFAEDRIRRAIRYKHQLTGDSMNILSKITTSESVCVHIRLGDYLLPRWKDKLFICTPSYYSQAMTLMRNKVNNPKFFVFSNRPSDFEIIRNEYALGDVHYVDLGNSDVEDMELMRNCKHFIMSNSTYSWWAQFLADNSGKTVVAPSRFNNYPEWDMTDIYQENWNLIEV